ncbi:MAG: tRNA (adenosine(37)-N6)-dimethylallyltransferase MiaA [Verrucomicrobiota bacterium]
MSPVFLAGPTAVGKSSVALRLAELLGGEIISVDSMQVYRGLDIGTSKPTAAERARVPHHLLDVADLDQPFDAARFVVLARAAVADLTKRGKRPIFCGGTGLYFRAYLEGLGDAPPANPALRAELEAAPLEQLLRELEQRDPATFARIDRANPRRVVRAVEVIRLTGKPFSAQRAGWEETPPPEFFFCLQREPADLRARIDARVDAMFAAGLVDETRALLARGLEKNRTAMQAIGYRQVVEHLRGERSLAETIDLVKTKTRQYAKRQLTWFRAQPGVQWLEPDTNLDTTADQLAARVG